MQKAMVRIELINYIETLNPFSTPHKSISFAKILSPCGFYML